MTELLSHEDADRRLARVAARMSRAGYDPSRTVRRLWWERRKPLVALLVFAALLFAATASGRWWTLLFGLLPLLKRFERWQESRKAQREALLSNDDFLERERKNVESRLLGVRNSVLLHLAIAAVFAFSASRGLGHVSALWVLASALVVVALFNLLVTGPALLRELRDLGGEDEYGWVGAGVVFLALLVFLALPLVLLYRALRRVVRRLRGLPDEPEEPDDESEEKS